MSTIFERFTINKNGAEIKLRIQDKGDIDDDKIIDFMIEKQYFAEESFFKASGKITGEALVEVRDMFHLLLQKEIGTCLVCCLDKDGDIVIVGSNILYYDLDKIDEEDDFPKTPQLKNFFRIITTLPDKKNLLNVKSFIGGAGLIVDSNYRGFNIATKLLEARKPLLSKLDKEATGAWFTSIGSQKAAEKAGYTLKDEITSLELGKLTNLDFSHAPDVFKLLVLFK